MDRQQAVTAAQQYLKQVKPLLDYDSAYLFGSYATNRQREDSDIDIGIMVNHLAGDYLTTMKTLYRLRRKLDVRIEPHLYVSGHDPLGFAENVVKKGIRL